MVLTPETNLQISSPVWNSLCGLLNTCCVSSLCIGLGMVTSSGSEYSALALNSVVWVWFSSELILCSVCKTSVRCLFPFHEAHSVSLLFPLMPRLRESASLGYPPSVCCPSVIPPLVLVQLTFRLNVMISQNSFQLYLLLSVFVHVCTASVLRQHS